MRLLGFNITRARKKALQTVGTSQGGWWPIIGEPFAGAWQTGSETNPETVLTYSALYSCVTLIASDIAKMRPRLIKMDSSGVWTEAESPAFSPFLREPNHYQNRITFVQWWLISKLLHGNTYALKRRDERGVTVAAYPMDPTRVSVLMAPDGSVFYELRTGDLATLADVGQTITVPAREVMHDVMVPLFHPLIGVTPIYACGLSAWQGIKIQGTSTKFFQNGSQPGGVLSAPGTIAQATADRLKAYWETNFSGDNAGKVAVLGDGLKYEAMSVKPVDAQLIEQLEWTGKDVCSAYHVPPYMVGVGSEPTYANAEIRTQQYYSQCLQILIESLEACLRKGLELPTYYDIDFDLDDLLRMDSATKMKVAADGVGGAIFTPNEARQKFGLRPVPGGNTPYMQQQMYSLEALNRRDQAPPTPEPSPGPPVTPDHGQGAEDEARAITTWQIKAAALGLVA
jgi:HK97 family phage portal protein